MVLDHSILYFGEEDSVIRMTITRAVEPLYVFVFGYLAGLRNSSLPIRRWLELWAAAIAETVLHSMREGHLHTGILMGLALVWPLVIVLKRAPETALITLSFALSCISLIEIPLGPLGVDYGPALVVSQITMAIVVQRSKRSAILLMTSLWLCHCLTAGILHAANFPLGSATSTLLIGHPIAIGIVVLVQKSLPETPKLMHRITTQPLMFYVGHLTILTVLAAALRES